MLENLTARGRSAGGKDRYYVPMLIDDVRWTVLVERKKLVDFPSKMVLALVLVIAVDAATNE